MYVKWVRVMFHFYCQTYMQHATFALRSSQENVGEDHLALKLAGEVVETGLWGPTTVGPRLLGATPVRMKHWRTHGPMWALSQWTAKWYRYWFDPTASSKKVPQLTDCRAPRQIFQWVNFKWTNWTFDPIFHTPTDSRTHRVPPSHISPVACVSSSLCAQSKKSTGNKEWTWSSDGVLRRLRHTFLTWRRRASESLKRNANTGRCLWISPARWLY